MPQLSLKPGEVYRMEGQLSLEVKSGKVSISGGLRERGDTVVIPRAKSVPMEAESETLIDYTPGADAKVEQLPGRTIPKEWDALIAEIVQTRPKVILVIGNVDVGKTFLTTYVGNTLLRHGIKMGAVDSDVGQADIGPPTTMGLGIFERPVALLYEVPTKKTYFVGSMSPAGHTLEFVVGMKWLVEGGLEKADMVIVNTPGMTFGGPGRSLQSHVEELINPDLVIALQRSTELEHLLASISPKKIRRLSVSTKIRSRTPVERSNLRAMLLGKSFEGAGKLVLDMKRVRFERTYLKTGVPLNPSDLGRQVIYAEKIPEGLVLVTKGKMNENAVKELELKFGPARVIKAGAEQNVIVGLVDDENEMLGLGVIDRINFERGQIIITTPVNDAAKVAAVQFGSMKVRPTGEEIGTVRPGTF
ncbi:MAG: Clp1/GlmU family protein [Candidatus Hadarchaeota archaeon]